MHCAAIWCSLHRLCFPGGIAGRRFVDIPDHNPRFRWSIARSLLHRNVLYGHRREGIASISIAEIGLKYHSLETMFAELETSSISEFSHWTGEEN